MVPDRKDRGRCARPTTELPSAHTSAIDGHRVTSSVLHAPGGARATAEAPDRLQTGSRQVTATEVAVSKNAQMSSWSVDCSFRPVTCLAGSLTELSISTLHRASRYVSARHASSGTLDPSRIIPDGSRFRAFFHANEPVLVYASFLAEKKDHLVGLQYVLDQMHRDRLSVCMEFIYLTGFMAAENKSILAERPVCRCM